MNPLIPFLVFFFSGINCQLILNRRPPPPGFGSLLAPGGPRQSPVNSPFADDTKTSDDSGFEELIRLLQPKSLWDEDNDEYDGGFPFKGSNNNNPFGLGLLGDQSKKTIGGDGRSPNNNKNNRPQDVFNSFPLFGDLFKPVLEPISKPKQPVGSGSGSGGSGRVPLQALRKPAPKATIAELITLHNLTWQDFIPHVPRILIPGIELTVNLARMPPPSSPKKAVVMGEMIAKLNDALRSIFPPSTGGNITKVELNINEQGTPMIVNAQVQPSANKSEDGSFVHRIADRLSAIFKKEDKESKSKDDGKQVKNSEDKQSPNALVRFFYFISRRSSTPPQEAHQNTSKAEMIEGKMASEAYSTGNGSSEKAACSILAIWALSVFAFLAFSAPSSSQIAF